MAYNDDGYLGQDDLENDPTIQKWTVQAQDAMNAGVDPVSVNKVLRKKMEDRGYDVAKTRLALFPSTNDDDNSDELKSNINSVWNSADKQTKRDYASAVIPEAIKDINTRPDSPDRWADVQGGADVGKAPQTFMGEAGKAFSQTARTGYRGLLDLAGSMEASGLSPAHLGVPNQDTADTYFAQAQAIKDQQEDDAEIEAKKAGYPTLAGKVGGGIGSLGAGLLTAGAGPTFATPRDVLEDGGTPGQAWGATTLQGSTMAVQAATAGLGPAVATLATPAEGWLSRTLGNQIVPDNMKQDAADPITLGLEAAGGFLGGKGVGAAKKAASAAEFDRNAPADDIPKTGDMHFDAGIEAYKKAANEDMDKPLPQYGEKGQMGLELPQQKTDEPTLVDLFNDSTKDASAVEAARQAAIDNPVDRSPMQQAQLQNLAEREGRLPNATQPTIESPAQGSLFAEETPEQQSLGALPQGTATPEAPTAAVTEAPPEAGAPTPEDPSTAPITKPLPPTSVQMKTDFNALRGQNVRLDGGVRTTPSPAPGEVMRKWTNGTLTSGDVLDAIRNNADGMYTKAPALQAMMDNLHGHAMRLGGRDVGHEMFNPNNPVHAAWLDKEMKTNPEMARRFENGTAPKAVYIPDMGKVLWMKPDFDMATAVHESAHGVTERAYSAGEAGKLTGEAKQAFNGLNDLFKVVQDAMIEKHGDPSINMNHENYGVSDIHEYTSEVYGNSRFRTALKNLDISKLPITDSIKSVIGKASNVFDATRLLWRKMMGMGPKMDSAFDAMFAAHDKFLNSVNPKDLPTRMEADARLNRAAGPEGEVGDEPTLRRPRTTAEVGARELLTEGGNVPEATNARRFVQNNVNAARAKSTAFKNLAESERGNVNIDHVKDVLTNTPNAKNALSAIRQVSPRLADALNEMRQRKYDMGLKIADEVYRNPNSAPAALKIADHIAQHSLEWLPRIYARDKVPDWTSDMFKKADKGDAEALARVNGAKQYLANKLLPGADKLNAMKGDDLADLYRAHVGLDPDTQYKGFDTNIKQQQMRAQIASKINDYGNVDTFLDNMTRRAAELHPDDVSAITTYFKNIKQGSNVLATRTHAPEALRKLWGEISDPLAQMYYGVEEQASAHAQLKAQNDLRDTGLQNGLFAEKPTTKNDFQLTGESFGPMQGLWTTKDVARTIQSQRALSSNLSDLMTMSIGDMGGKLVLPKAIDLAARGVGLAARTVKMANIIMNPGNFLTNALGSPLQLASNGNFNPASWAKGAKIMAEVIGGGLKRSLSPEAERAYRLGLLEFSQTQELQAHPHSAAVRQLIDTMGKQPNPVQWLGKQGKEAWRLYHETYGAMDLWSKLANFENEYALQKRWNPKMSEPELEAMVAHRVNNSNITPSLTPQIIKAAERSGATQYAPYYYQTVKTTITNLGYGIDDIRKGLAEGNTEKALHGAARLGGVTAYLTAANAMYAGLTAGVLGLKGLVASRLDDNDPRKKAMDKDDYMSSITPSLITDPNNKAAGEYVMDVSRPNPFGPVQQPVNRLYDAIRQYTQGDKEGSKQSLDIALKQIGDMTFNNPNAMWKQLFKATSGSKPSLSTQAPDTYNDMSQLLTQKLGLSNENADRVIGTAMTFTPKMYKNIVQAKEIPGDTPIKGLIAAGVGAQKLDFATDLQKYIGPQLKGEITTARKPYLDLIKSDYDISQDSLDKQFSSHLKDLVEPYNKMKAAVDAAKAQGISERDLGIRLLTSGVGKEVAGMLYNNQPVPAMMLLGNPVGSLKTEIKAETDPDKQQKMIERAQRKVEMFQKLFEKYGNVTMDQLEAQ